MAILAALVLLSPLAVSGATSDGESVMPAGTQVTGEPEVLPPQADLDAFLSAIGAGERIVILASRSTRDRRSPNRSATRVEATISSPDGSWRTVLVEDLKGLAPPAGFPLFAFGASHSALASGQEGLVALGSAQWYARGYGTRTRVGLIWHSSDGRTWRRVDARRLLAGGSVALGDVLTLPGGRYVASGDQARSGSRGRSSLFVLLSGDGLSWKRGAEIAATWSLATRALGRLGESLALWGVEYVCTGDSGHHTTFSLGGRLRLWLSRDGGTTWRETELDGVAALERGKDPPARAAGCPRRFEEKERFATRYGDLLLSDGAVVILDTQMTRASTSLDGIAWREAELPDASPPEMPYTGRGIQDAALSYGPDGKLVLRIVEYWRDESNLPVDDAFQILAWSSVDGGVSWTRLPAGRPFQLNGTARLFAVAQDEVLLIDASPFGSASTVPARMWRLASGPLLEWLTCVPVAGADCAYSSLTGFDLRGVDLSGIDLSYATISDSDLSGTNLRGANLRAATFSGSTDLSGADLSGAQAQGTRFWGRTEGMDVTGANLRGALGGLPLELLDDLPPGSDVRDIEWDVPKVRPAELDLRGRDLGRAKFTGPPDAVDDPTARGDLRGADFGKTRLNGSRFMFVDLTGANLKGAAWESLYFGPDVICPDGKPYREEVYGPEACRLKERR